MHLLYPQQQRAARGDECNEGKGISTGFLETISSLFSLKIIKCRLRGHLIPACNSAAMIDRFVLGTSHLYAKPAYGNLKECNKTRFGIPESSPSWCYAPFDPEGVLGSLTAAVTCIIGLQFGHILVQMQVRTLYYAFVTFCNMFDFVVYLCAHLSMASPLAVFMCALEIHLLYFFQSFWLGARVLIQASLSISSRRKAKA